jgi:hypothetical protein
MIQTSKNNTSPGGGNTDTTAAGSESASADEPEGPTDPDDPTVTEDGSDDTDTDETSHLSTAYVAAVRFAFPVAGFVLAVLYIENTYGRIRLDNLYYPYFVIAMLGLFGLTIFVDEVRDLLGRSPSTSFGDSVRARAEKWKRSIGLVFIGLVYLATIEWVGFFVTSFLAMVAIMALGGLRDLKKMIGVSILVLGAIYLLFIRLMGLQPPVGVFGI